MSIEQRPEELIDELASNPMVQRMHKMLKDIELAVDFLRDQKWVSQMAYTESVAVFLHMNRAIAILCHDIIHPKEVTELQHANKQRLKELWAEYFSIETSLYREQITKGKDPLPAHRM